MVGLTGTRRRNNNVVTMKPLHVAIRPIGNSHGVVIPKPLLSQLGLVGEVAMSVERGAIVLRKPAKATRHGWAEAAKLLAAHDGDELVMGEFGNEGDAELTW